MLLLAFVDLIFAIGCGKSWVGDHGILKRNWLVLPTGITNGVVGTYVNIICKGMPNF